MNKEINTNAFNIAIFDKNSIEWVSDREIMNLKIRSFLEYANNFAKRHILERGEYITLSEILGDFGIKVKDNQALAGWDTDNYDPSVPIFEYEYDEENDRYILNFVTCDETALLKHYEKDRMASIKKYCDYDASVLQDVYNDIWKIAAISSDHGNALMDIIGPDKYAEVMEKQGK